MDLKHLMIAAIVANTAKSGPDSGQTVLQPTLTSAIHEGGRPSYEAFGDNGKSASVTSAGDMRPETSPIAE
jgi:hypothetical protein